jgi:site-specific DNA-methyltransferase (adenine-specific)
MSQATFGLRGRNPDVLTCIANLSNDEVFTPPELANQMLDTVEKAWADANRGSSIWADSTVTFFDPFTKSGVFLREITTRLVSGLEDEIPDLNERVDHILTKQVFGIAITELTSLLARRSLYCSKWANSKHSITQSFATAEGNIWFERTEHTWIGGTEWVLTADADGNQVRKPKNGKCQFCRAAQAAFERGEDLETHAYAFIHSDDIETRLAEIFGDGMRFDVIVGNPPYQIAADAAGKNVVPIYNAFVTQAMKLSPRLLSMVIPSRWMVGGRGLDDFRELMLSGDQVSHLVDYPNSAELFPSVDIKGGVCYFLWGSEQHGTCATTTHREGIAVGPIDRDLGEYDVFVRDSRALPILQRVLGRAEPSLAAITSVRDPFGSKLGSNYHGYSTKRSAGDLRFVLNQSSSQDQHLWVDRPDATRNLDLIDEWKVFLPKAGPGNSGGHVIPDIVIGRAAAAEPGSVCSATYLVVGPLRSQSESESLCSYLRTRFVRFLVSLRKPSQNTTRDTYSWVPQQEWDRTWTDAELYEMYSITEEEQSLIESMIRPMDAEDG